jgi:TP901 family phage tail tape measure protein
MANEVRVLITAKDSASPTIKGVAGGIIAAEAATKALKVGMDFAIGSAVKFERDMDQVGAVLNATEGDMKKMRGEALKIGADTSKSAGEAAHAMEELAAGGRSVAQIMGGEARAAVALAEAGNYDLASSARTIATTMDVWKDSTLSTTDVVNRLAGAANTSRFGVEDMSMAIAQGGGVAASAGIDFQDFSTAIAATASSFNSGSDAGTSFKTFITALSGNSEKAKGAIQDLGLSFYDAQGAIRPMADIVQELHDKLGPLSQEQQTVALKTIFGNDAYRTAAGLMQMTGAEFEALSRTMGNTDAADIAKQRMGNLSGSLEELRGSLETIGIEMGTKAIPALTGMAEAGVTAVNAFGGLPDSTQNLILLGATATATLPLLVSQAKRAGDAVTGMGAAMKAGKLNASGMALAVTGLAVGLDVLSQQTTGVGLLDRVFGDPQKLVASKEAMRDFEARVYAAGDGADKVAVATKALAEAQDELAAAGGRAALEQSGLENVLLGTDNRIFGLNVGLSKNVDHLKDIEAKVRAAGAAMKDSGATALDMAAAYHSLNPELRKAFDEATNITAVMGTQEFAMESAARVTDGWAGSIQKATPELAEMGEEMDAAVLSAEDLEAAIKNVALAFSDLDPATQAARTEHALLNEELGDLLAKGDAMTESERARAKVIKDELLPALDKQIEAADENREAIEGVTEAVQKAIGPGALPGLKAAMDEAGRSHEAQIDVMGLLARAYDDVRTGNIPALMTKMEDLKKVLTPSEWKALALDSGSALGKGFQQGVYNEMEPSKAAAEGLMDAAITQAEMAAYPGGVQVGESMAAGVAAGLAAAQAAAAVSEAAKGVVNKALGAMKAEAAIESPSGLMRDEVGIPMAQGIAEGLYAGQSEVSKAAEAIVGAAWVKVGASLGGSTVPSWVITNSPYLSQNAMPTGMWNPNAPEQSGTVPTGAYNQNLVWDPGANAWVYPWEVGQFGTGPRAPFLGKDLVHDTAVRAWEAGNGPYPTYTGGREAQTIVFNVETINAATPADAELAAGDLVYALGSRGLAI